MKKKLFLYVHDEKGFGHLSRILKIYYTLEESYDVVILLSGTLVIQDPLVRYIQLPFATEFEPVLKDRSSIEQGLLQRREFLKDILNKQGTFSLFIDYFPFGRHIFFKEIDMMIDMAHMTGGKVFSVMRDIFTGTITYEKNEYLQALANMRKYFFPDKLDDILLFEKQKIFPYALDNNIVDMLPEIFLDYYLGTEKIDKVLVFGDEDVYDIRNECPLSNRYREKFCFLGYIVHNTINENLQEKQNYILVSLGGNIFDTKKFVSLMLLCLHLKEIPIKIIIGSMVDEGFSKKIQKRFSAKHIEFLDFSSNVSDVFQKAKVFIGGGGYGTCTDLLAYKIPAFLYLNCDSIVTINKTEQYARITHLSQYTDIEYVENFNYGTLKKIIHIYQKGPQKVSDSINVSGSKNLKKLLGRIL